MSLPRQRVCQTIKFSNSKMPSPLVFFSFYSTLLVGKYTFKPLLGAFNGERSLALQKCSWFLLLTLHGQSWLWVRKGWRIFLAHFVLVSLTHHIFFRDGIWYRKHKERFMNVRCLQFMSVMRWNIWPPPYGRFFWWLNRWLFAQMKGFWIFFEGWYYQLTYVLSSRSTFWTSNDPI